MTATTRRTFRDFDAAPRDGTPFSIAIPVRFNPNIHMLEAVFQRPDGKKEWAPVGYSPRLWCNLLPVPYELPDTNWFATGITLTYLARPLTRRERLLRWLNTIITRVRGLAS